METEIEIQDDEGIFSHARIGYPELKPVPWDDEYLTLFVNPTSQNSHNFLLRAFDPLQNYEERLTGSATDLDSYLRRATDIVDRIVVHTKYSDGGHEANIRAYANTGGQINTGAYFHWIAVEDGEVMVNETNIDNFRPVYVLGKEDCPNLIPAVNEEFEEQTGQERPLPSEAVFERPSDGQHAFLLSNGKRFEFTKMHKNDNEGEPQYDWGDFIWATEDFEEVATEPGREHELTQEIVRFLRE
jgi:hypothetical protein